jgi:hypothetical protein
MSWSSISDYLWDQLIGFPYNKYGLRLVIGTNWTGTVPFEEDDVIILRHVPSVDGQAPSGSPTWTEDGSYVFNITTNRLLMNFMPAATGYTHRVSFAVGTNVGTNWVGGAGWFKHTTSGPYTFKEIWNINPNAEYFNAGVITSTPNMHNDAFKSMEIIWIDGTSISSSSSSSSKSSSSSSSSSFSRSSSSSSSSSRSSSSSSSSRSSSSSSLSTSSSSMSWSSISDYLPENLSGFPYNRYAIRVVIGTKWSESSPFEEDDVIILKHVPSNEMSGSHLWTDTGNDLQPSGDGMIALSFSKNGFGAEEPKRMVPLFITYTGTMWVIHNPVSWRVSSVEGSYVFKDIWNSNPNGLGIDLAMFTSTPVNIHNDAFKSMEFIWIDGTSSSSSSSSSSRSSSSSSSSSSSRSNSSSSSSSESNASESSYSISLPDGLVGFPYQIQVTIGPAFQDAYDNGKIFFEPDDVIILEKVLTSDYWWTEDGTLNYDSTNNRIGIMFKKNGYYDQAFVHAWALTYGTSTFYFTTMAAFNVSVGTASYQFKDLWNADATPMFTTLLTGSPTYKDIFTSMEIV